ncbi:hypothetical protein CKAH01_01991 [Colletotrichum kahawae]|uniref:Uncharacterized protein n=1 Tax=Colletotrichum kahawae TaxID=34407 RepID=A0AAE0CZK1_COLKA|nr:hypothetical protein CKAH01_01991 [Colletotrichum kahawae]
MSGWSTLEHGRNGRLDERSVGCDTTDQARVRRRWQQGLVSPESEEAMQCDAPRWMATVCWITPTLREESEMLRTAGNERTVSGSVLFSPLALALTVNCQMASRQSVRPCVCLTVANGFAVAIVVVAGGGAVSCSTLPTPSVRLQFRSSVVVRWAAGGADREEEILSWLPSPNRAPPRFKACQTSGSVGRGVHAGYVRQRIRD